MLKSKYTDILIFLLFFGIQAELQGTKGAFDSEFGGYPDEAAHYITGLMVHDYVFGMSAVSPRKFAENYYIHYPKVAIGHWPPFFYMVQSLWMLIFSCSRISVILMIAFLTALSAESIYLILKKEFGFFSAFGMGLLLILLPLIQEYSGMVMAEILVALLSFWAVICFAQFLDTEKSFWSIGFGVCAAAAILSKGNGLALASVPPLGILFSRRFYLTTRLNFWYPAVIVVILCGPWYWLTLDMVRNGWEKEEASLSFILSAIPYYALSLVEIGGIAFLTLAVLGFVRELRTPVRNGKVKGLQAASAALIFSVWGFHTLVPAGMESRHLITIIPAMLIFFAAGISFVSERFSTLNIIDCRPMPVLLILCFSLVFYYETNAMPRKAWIGFGEVSRHILSKTELQKTAVMISSDERGEGMLISELAMQEHRPGHVVLRASKMLAESRWGGAEYKVLYSNPKEIMDCLRAIPAGIVIIDESVSPSPRFEHHRLLKETVRTYPDQWEFSGSYPIIRDGISHTDAIKVWRLKGHQPVKKIQVQMAGMLGKVLEKVF